MMTDYFRLSPDELRKILSENPPDTPHYKKAKDALISRDEPLSAYVHQEYPKVLYHPQIAPDGSPFQSADDTKGLSRKGWVDSPAKFPKPSQLLERAQTCYSRWKWLFAAIVALIAAVGGLVGIIWGSIQIIDWWRQAGT